jgi:hypothetical protein
LKLFALKICNGSFSISFIFVLDESEFSLKNMEVRRNDTEKRSTNAGKWRTKGENKGGCSGAATMKKARSTIGVLDVAGWCGDTYLKFDGTRSFCAEFIFQLVILDVS